MSTKIEWTQETWNPIIGCKKISDGCKNCYAEKMAWRLANMGNENAVFYQGVVTDKGKWNGKTVMIDDRLSVPKKWKNPKRIFVCSMSDIFMAAWPKIDEIFFTCHHHEAEHHTYLFLTKRIEAAWYYFNSPIYKKPTMKRHEFLKHKNIWLGVTVENPDHYDRIKILLQIPAAVRFVSFEPMLARMKFISQYVKKLDWGIIGCESGPGRRSTDVEWIIDLKDTFVLYDKPIFIKQAEIAGKIVKMPKIDGEVWDQYPGELS